MLPRNMPICRTGSCFLFITVTRSLTFPLAMMVNIRSFIRARRIYSYTRTYRYLEANPSPTHACQGP